MSEKILKKQFYSTIWRLKIWKVDWENEWLEKEKKKKKAE